MAHITDTDKWPSFAEELGRKAITTLEKWLLRYDAGKITRRELYVLVDGLHDTCSGLVPRSDLEVLEKIHKGIRSGSI